MQASRFYISISRIAGAVIGLSLLFQGNAMATGDASGHKLELIQTHIRAITRELEKSQGKQGEIEAKLRHSEQAIGVVENAIRRTRKRLMRQESRLYTLKQRENQQNSRLQQQVQALSDQILSAYKIGREPRLQILLSAQNPGKISRMLAYYDYLNRARLKEIANAKQSLAALIQTKQALKTATNELDASLTQQRAHQTALDQAEKQRRIALSQINRTINSQKNRLATLKGDAKRLQDVVNTISHAVAYNTPINALNHIPFDRLAGRLPWPVTGHIRARFGEPRAGSDDVLRWQGTFIDAAIGTPIHAVDAGRIVFADWLRGYGLLLIIDHGKGYMTLYGHDQAIYHPVGYWVRAGEVVASVGNSGGDSSSGVYFSIRHDGHPLNPAHWCSGNP